MARGGSNCTSSPQLISDTRRCRLNTFTLWGPPLCERQEGILHLAKRFVDLTNPELRKNVKGFSQSAVDALLACDWLGNVRQLRSVIRRAVLLADDTITEQHMRIDCVSPKLILPRPRGIQTTSITVHEEGKTDRGALKVVSREKLEDGRFRIIYRGYFRDDSFADVVSDWLKKHGERRRA